MNIREIIDELENSYRLLQTAIGSDSKPLAGAFARLGKPVSADWIYRQGQPQTVKRANVAQKWFLWKLAFDLTDKARDFRRLEVYGEMLSRKLKQFLGLVPFPVIDIETEQRLIVVKQNLDAVLGYEFAEGF